MYLVNYFKQANLNFVNHFNHLKVHELFGCYNFIIATILFGQVYLAGKVIN